MCLLGAKLLMFWVFLGVWGVFWHSSIFFLEV